MPNIQSKHIVAIIGIMFALVTVATAMSFVARALFSGEPKHPWGPPNVAVVASEAKRLAICTPADHTKQQILYEQVGIAHPVMDSFRGTLSVVAKPPEKPDACIVMYDIDGVRCTYPLYSHRRVIYDAVSGKYLRIEKLLASHLGPAKQNDDKLYDTSSNTCLDPRDIE